MALTIFCLVLFIYFFKNKNNDFVRVEVFDHLSFSFPNFFPAKIRDFNGIDRSGSPIPIEYLPAENTMSNRIRLMILYQGRPTTTIAVGDPLTFRLEPSDGYGNSDLFATNVVARDPYSGRSVMLIDRHG